MSSRIANRSTYFRYIFGFLFLIVYHFALSQENNEKHFADSWLVIEPQLIAWPAFSNTPDVNGDTISFKQLLNSVSTDEINWAKAGKAVYPQAKNGLLWQKNIASKSGFLNFKLPAKQKTAWVFVGGFLETNRFVELELELEAGGLAALILEGKQQLFVEEVAKKGETKKKSTKIKLTPGKHFILIKSLYDKRFACDWKLKLSFDKKIDDHINWSINPEKTMNMDLLLDGKRLESISIHPNGELLMLNYSETNPPEGEKSNWTEIRTVTDQKLLYSIRHSTQKQLKFHPQEAAFFYRINQKDKSEIWLHSLETGEDKLLVDNIEDLGFYRINKQATKLFYSKQFKAEDQEKTGLKKLEGMPDRWPWWRNRSQLFFVDLNTGLHQQLTSGNLSTNLEDISPNSELILISQSQPDFSQRPYSKQWMMLLDLTKMTVDTLWTSHFGGSAGFSPDGKKLLVSGGPLLFGTLGKNVPEGVIPNDYDTQAYIYDLQSKKVEPITKNFDPKILSAIWSHFDGHIYFHTEDQSYQRIVKYDIQNKTFSPLKTAVDVVDGFDISNKKPLLVYLGTSISTPEKAYLLSLNDASQSLIDFPEEAEFESVRFGETMDWNFTSSDGNLISGHIYYPPQFDNQKKYPLIVYYYGGTNPIDRSFRGRYPKNLFAAHGYVVYVVTPSGATGFGQEFSARHVNNWGSTVADEIIDATQYFYRNNTFIDSTAIGCIGASYGGFMTMLLATKTDIFAAAISHAGISSISSYWGEGFWGYLYSSAATANNFPWNNPELYTKQSPLFNADKVTTPLLLLHGGSDTNVPPGESIQLYTALKLLGKTVEYIEIEGQDHHIIDYKKRKLWQQSILAWYDYYLKNQPEWWKSMYPDKNY
ncbi:MAG: prolyl oligopeptidase family serine peptidase [Bacteroidales bacterium]|jgi:dipeptidyl aminopeptidase/acylaminoacyl peptidase|nr:prolyl oligopeptidase family serine peptidase [Bacteroidales bacterium]